MNNLTKIKTLNSLAVSIFLMITGISVLLAGLTDANLIVLGGLQLILGAFVYIHD